MDSRKYILNLQKNDPENRKCVDCRENSPTWIDLKYGSFLCTRCAGLHRELGTDYCVVKSISLDNVSKDQLKIFEFTKGNTFVNLEYEAINKSEINRVKPQFDSSNQTVREFIRRKYRIRQFYKQYVKPVEKRVNLISKPSPIVHDMIHFDQHIQEPTIEFEVNWNQPQQHQQHQPQQHQPQQNLTQKQIAELEYKNKVNDILNMFRY